LITDVIPFADEALLMRLAHVCKEFIITKEALAAEFAKRVGTSVDLLFVLSLSSLVWARMGEHGGQMQREYVGRV
jgi:hypothetical protein